MNKTIIVLVVLMLSLVVPATASTRIILHPSDDSYVSGWDPGLNFGSEYEIRVGDGGALEYRTYFKFNLSSVPVEKVISSATLVLYCNLATTNGTPVGTHYLNDDSWDESTINWNNAPLDFNSEAVINVINSTGEKTWIVTKDVNYAYNNDKIYSLVVKVEGDYSNNWSYFFSKEDEFPPNWPRLEIIYEGPKYGGGNGTPEEPFLIYTAEQLNQIGENYEDWDKEFLLMNDINLSQYKGMEFHIISTDWQTPFTGHFNGNNHVISNLTYTLTPGVFANYVGLFGVLGTGGLVNDLGLDKPTIYCDLGNSAGALVGTLFGGIVERCWAEDVNIFGAFRAGGLIGEVYEGALYDSYVNGGQVLMKYNYCGGLIGENYGSIVRCYSTSFVGGTGSGFGGLVGHDDGGTVTDSFWDINTSGRTYSWGGVGKTTAEMQTKRTFTDAGWDFVGETINGPNDIWKIKDGLDYPRLAWEADEDITVELDLSSLWMYQNLPGRTASNIIANVITLNDPLSNSAYTYTWEIELPSDVTVSPITVAGGGTADAYWTFAATGCNIAGGLSDSGQTFKVKVTVAGNDFGNLGTAEKEFAIALLGDINNDGVVNITDRSIANMFMRTGIAGSFTLKDCDLNCDTIVNITDRSIANSIMRGALGTNHVSNHCPLR